MMIGPENPRLISVKQAEEHLLGGIELLLGPICNIQPAAPEPAVIFRYPQIAVSRPVDTVDVGQSSMSPDTEGEEESVCVELDPYKIRTDCPSCDRILRFVVACTPTTLRELQRLLLSDLHFVCPTCVKKNIRDGR